MQFVDLWLPLFVGTFSPQGERALRRFRTSLPKDLQGFLTEYESGLADDVASDFRYEFRLRAAIELAPKDPDAIAIQFTHLGDMTDEERAVVEEMGRKGQVIVRDRKQPVSGLGRLMPRAAAAEVQKEVPFVFNVNHFVAAWKNLKVRPAQGARNPERTNPDWCEYDEAYKHISLHTGICEVPHQEMLNAARLQGVDGNGSSTQTKRHAEPGVVVQPWRLTRECTEHHRNHRTKSGYGDGYWLTSARRPRREGMSRLNVPR